MASEAATRRAATRQARNMSSMISQGILAAQKAGAESDDSAEASATAMIDEAAIQRTLASIGAAAVGTVLAGDVRPAVARE